MTDLKARVAKAIEDERNCWLLLDDADGWFAWRRDEAGTRSVRLGRGPHFTLIVPAFDGVVSLACAEKALEAMREPTAAMHKAGNDELDDMENGNGHDYCEHVWYAMVDAALKS